MTAAMTSPDDGDDPNFPTGQERGDAQGVRAGGESDYLSRQYLPDAQVRRAAEVPTPPTGQMHVDAQADLAGGGPTLFDPLLALLADNLDDLERTWIANENRLRQLTRDEPDSDGIERGFGLTEDNPVVAQLAAVVQSLKALEHGATLALQRRLRDHPLGPWVKRTRGVGPKQGARLIAAIGDPYWHDETSNEDGTVRHQAGPRTVSELWAYCGYRPGQRRRKGQKSNWSVDAKMRAHLVAEMCVRLGKATDTAYYQKYRGRRDHTAIAHPDWTDLHSHNDAVHVVAKEVLKDLWREARDVRGGQ